MKGLLLLILTGLAFLSCSPAKMEIRSKGAVLPDNTVVHYLEAGQGPALILVHGLGSSSEVWRDSIKLLSKSYRVIAPDLPGYGKSDKPRSDYSIEYHADALNKFINVLGVDGVTLAGNSQGGWIAAIVALNHPEKVKRLILVDSSGLRRNELPRVNPNPGTKEEERVLLHAIFYDKSMVTEKMVKDQWEYHKEIKSTVQAALESLKSRSPFLDDRLKSIKVPTLIIWGKQDILIPVELAYRFSQGIAGSKLVVIDRAGHLPQVEKPKAFYYAVKGFVRSW